MRTHCAVFPRLLVGSRFLPWQTLLFGSRDDNGVFSRELPPALNSTFVFFAAPNQGQLSRPTAFPRKRVFFSDFFPVSSQITLTRAPFRSCSLRRNLKIQNYISFWKIKVRKVRTVHTIPRIFALNKMFLKYANKFRALLISVYFIQY